MNAPRQLLLLFLFAAIGCGNSAAPPSPAAPGDSGLPAVDAGGSTTHEGEVTVAVYDEGVAAPDVELVFHTADGELIAMGRTGADGRATQSIPRGAMVTAFSVGAEGGGAYTVTALEPGDEIKIGGPYTEPPAPSPVGTAHVTVSDVFTGASFYQIDVGCTTGDLVDPGSVDLVLDASCLDEAATSFTVLALAMDENGEPIAYATAKDVPLTTGGPTEVALPPWSTEWTTTPVTVRGVPAEATLVDVLGEWVARQHLVAWTYPTSAPPDTTGSASFMWRIYRNLDWLEVGYRALAYFGPLDAEGGVGAGDMLGVSATREAPMIGSEVVIDLADALPRTRDLSVDDSHGTRVSWSTTIGSNDADYGTLDAFLIEGDRWLQWTVVIPAGSQAFQFPTLSAATAADLEPDHDWDYEVTFYDMGDVTGYDGPRRGDAGASQYVVSDAMLRFSHVQNY